MTTTARRVTAAFAELAGADPTSDLAASCARILSDNGLSQIFIDWNFENARVHVTRIARECFWDALEPIATGTDANAASVAFYCVLDNTVQALRPLQQSVCAISNLFHRKDDGDCVKRFRRMVHALFFSSAPDWFSPFLVTFFRLQFQAWDATRCHNIPSEATIYPALERFLTEVSPQLRELGWLSIFEFGYTSALLDQIDCRVRSVCSNQFASSVLNDLLVWYEASVSSWISMLCEPYDCSHCSERLKFSLFERVGEVRIDELFDIIVDYPESLGAIHDLAACLQHTHQQSLLIKSLVAAFEKRLLHPGAMTRDIVTQYISCLRVMRIIDPSGLITHNVIDPTCLYLRTRPDAIRVIVSALIDDSEPYGLLAELERPVAPGETIAFTGIGTSRANQEQDDDISEHWTPEPIVSYGEGVEPAMPGSSWWRRRSGGILTQLIHIFGSSDQLIEEYQNLLASLLMKCTDYNTEKEVHHLELLKQRFGETRFRSADVMIVDIATSKRINANIHKTIGERDFPLSSTIISHQFWPTFSDSEVDSSLRFPPPIQACVDEYSRHYEILKAPRELNWKSHLGGVDLTLAFDDGRSLSLPDVSPAHASILFAFTGSDSILSLDSISAVVNLPSSIVRRKLEFWLQKRVVSVSESGMYAIVEHDLGENQSLVSFNWDDDAEEFSTFSVETQQREKDKLLESYILGILPSSFGGFTLQRIDTILRSALVSGSSTYNRSEGELQDLLHQLVQENKLECIEGLYKQSAKQASS